MRKHLNSTEELLNLSIQTTSTLNQTILDQTTLNQTNLNQTTLNHTILNQTTNQPHFLLPDYWTIPIFVIFIVTGVFGNCLVCLAISTNRELQSMTNYFLMSLAIADLLVCTIVMPFGAIVFFIGSWPLSQFWCIFYQTCDVLACSVSILHLMFISIGRYRGIRRPLQQRSESEHSTLFKVVLTWGLGMLLASPIPVLALVNMDNVMPEEYVCEMNNEYFLVIGSLLSFYIPMVIMVTTYVLTVHHLKKKKLGNLAGKRHVGISNLVANTLSTFPGALATPIASSTMDQRYSPGYSREAGQSELSEKSRELKIHDSTRMGRTTILSALPFLPRPAQQQTSTLSEEKASRVLGVVFSTFVICWAPFFIMNLVVVACYDTLCAPPAFLNDMALWLGYASSTINPLIYTVFNIKFRRSFGKLLLCRTNTITFRTSNTNSTTSF